MRLALVAAPKIEFVEDGHKYFVDGVDKTDRSWSAIAKRADLLPDLSNVPTHHLANAAARGSQIDDACALLMEGRPLHTVLERTHPEAQPYVEAYWDLWQKLRPGILGLRVQTPLYCRELDFCCTPDWDDLVSVNDLKTIERLYRSIGLQIAAQELARGDVMDGRVFWLRRMRRKNGDVYTCEVHTRHQGNRRIFSPLDYQVVEAACQGDYHADVIRRWRDGE